MENIFIFLLIQLILNIKFVINDCGLPAIPYNAQINDVKHTYLENDTIEYHCELDELKLIGRPIRKCKNSRWVGFIPRCVQELSQDSIGTIELIDNDFQDYDNNNITFNKESGAAIYADYNINNCLDSGNMSKKHSWNLTLTQMERHISYIELLVLDKNNLFTKTEVNKMIKSTKISQPRKCISELIARVNNTVRIGVTCIIEFNENTIENDWSLDETNVITIEFNVKPISICEIRIYKMPDLVHHWCGSADVVLYSSRTFIRHNTIYSGNSHYRYTCNEGYELIGNQDVRCGVDNHWSDRFPFCKPIVACPYPPSNHTSISFEISNEHLFRYNGYTVAIIESVVWYTCAPNYNNKSIMFGDSVRVCDFDGEWTGIDPICIHDYELNDYSDYVEEIHKNVEYFTDFEAFDEMQTTANRIAQACGIPAMPLYAKPITFPKYKNTNRHADLRSYYPNGTVIQYQCESAYVWVTGNMAQRVCVNGKWSGSVGKCEINLGNRLSLESIDKYHWNENGQFVNDYIEIIQNSTNGRPNQRFVFKRNVELNGDCPTFAVNYKQRWTLRLNQSAKITNIVVMLHPGPFFNTQNLKITDPNILAQSPVTAILGETLCQLMSASDNRDTYFHFTCDLDKPKNKSQEYYSQIDLDIDPQRFVQNYTAINISICYLSIFTSAQDCGTPDIPLYSTVAHNSQTRQWIYSCDQGYQLVGDSIITCNLNGRWEGEFPICRKKELCPLKNQNYQYLSLLKYNNTRIEINNKKVDKIDLCLTNDKSVIIGPRVRICTKTGQWSGTDPFCKELSVLRTVPETKDYVLTSVLIVIIVIFLIIVSILFIYYRKMAKKRLILENIDSPYSL